MTRNQDQRPSINKLQLDSPYYDQIIKKFRHLATANEKDIEIKDNLTDYCPSDGSCEGEGIIATF